MRRRGNWSINFKNDLGLHHAIYLHVVVLLELSKHFNTNINSLSRVRTASSE